MELVLSQPFVCRYCTKVIYPCIFCPAFLSATLLVLMWQFYERKAWWTKHEEKCSKRPSANDNDSAVNKKSAGQCERNPRCRRPNRVHIFATFSSHVSQFAFREVFFPFCVALWGVQDSVFCVAFPAKDIAAKTIATKSVVESG